MSKVENSEQNPSGLLPLKTIDQTLVVESRIIADALGIEHATLIKTIEKYQPQIEGRFGRVGFEVIPFQTKGGRQNFRVAYLTEEQATFIATLSRNTPQVVDFKARLVKSFAEARKPKELTRLEILQQALQTEKENLQLKQTVEYFTPKVEAFNHFMDGGKTLTMEEAAKSLGLGRNTLFAMLRNWGMILTTNFPAQYCIDRGYLILKQTTIKKGSKVEPYGQIFVTSTGLNYISEKIRGTSEGLALKGGDQ